jgi:hypothetical protein
VGQRQEDEVKYVAIGMLLVAGVIVGFEGPFGFISSAIAAIAGLIFGFEATRNRPIQ